MPAAGGGVPGVLLLYMQFQHVFIHNRLNKCGAISPRYNVAHEAIEDWVSRLLPSRLVWVDGKSSAQVEMVVEMVASMRDDTHMP